MNATKEFKITDHLGSTRVALRFTGTAEQLDYEPFGKPVTGDAPRKGFIDKEVDRESNLGDYGVRKYDSDIGRFLSVDPLWEEYRGWTPYRYGVNNSLTNIDPSGEDVIVLVDYEGAGGFGHVAVLIGNDEDGWSYYSKNGTSENFGLTGKADKTVIDEKFGTFKEFAVSTDEEHSRYDASFLLKADDVADSKMKEAAIDAATMNHDVLGCSCLDVAEDALDAGGFNKGNIRSNPSRPENLVSDYLTDRTPNRRFQMMKIVNEDSRDMTEAMQFFRNPYSSVPAVPFEPSPTTSVE